MQFISNLESIPALVEFTIKPAVEVLNVSTTYCEIKRLRQQTAGKLRVKDNLSQEEAFQAVGSS